MRLKFDEELAILNNELIEMGALIEQAIARAAKALELRDVDLAQQVIRSDDEIDDKEKEIERRCLKLLLMQQPVARDLSQISTALKMITDIERIGDHASDISELVIYLSEQSDIIVPEHIKAMAEATIKMVGDSIDSFVRRDLQLANEVIKYDDVVDELYGQVRREALAMIQQDVALGELAFDYLQVAKYYERIGDHAQNIAEWVIFCLTGIHKNQQVL